MNFFCTEPNNDEELDQLITLKFEGYEDMSVSEFQNKVWELTDTKEYRRITIHVRICHFTRNRNS